MGQRRSQTAELIGATAPLRNWDNRRRDALGGKLQRIGNLLAGEGILLHQFFNCHAVLQVLEHDSYRRTSVFENPRATDFAGDAFNGEASQRDPLQYAFHVSSGQLDYSYFIESM